MVATDLAGLLRGSPFLAGVGASVLAGAVATTLGALLVLCVRGLAERATNLLLGSAAGVMLAATMFSLLLPGYAAARAAGAGRATAALTIVAALSAGGPVLWLIQRHAPHEHFCKGCEGPGTERHRRIWLFVVTIALHNVPEGLAVGVGAASGDVVTGVGVTLGIGLPNVPEGLAVPAGLLAIGYRRATALLAGSGSGLVGPVGGVIGAGAVALSSGARPGRCSRASGPCCS